MDHWEVIYNNNPPGPDLPLNRFDEFLCFNSPNSDEPGVLTVITYLANKGRYSIGWNNFWGPQSKLTPRNNKNKALKGIYRLT